MRAAKVPGFGEIPNKANQFKCDFIFIHKQCGFIIIKLKAFDGIQLSPEQLEKTGEELKDKIKGFKELYKQFSSGTNCPLKIRGILRLPKTDNIKSKEDYERNYCCQLVDESFLNDRERFEYEIRENTSSSSFEPSEILLQFIAALFTYSRANLFHMSSNALGIYQMFQQYEQYHETYLDFIENEINDIRDSGK